MFKVLSQHFYKHLGFCHCTSLPPPDPPPQGFAVEVEWTEYFGPSSECCCFGASLWKWDGPSAPLRETGCSGLKDSLWKRIDRVLLPLNSVFMSQGLSTPAPGTCCRNVMGSGSLPYFITFMEIFSSGFLKNRATSSAGLSPFFLQCVPFCEDLVELQILGSIY